MIEFVCLVCPNGCTLRVGPRPDGGYAVRGQKCKRGEAFALEEMTAPKRTFSTTVRTIFPAVPVLPVRLSAAIPREEIFPVMAEINKVCIRTPVGRGAVILPDVLSLGADVIVTSNILMEGYGHE